jgi:hypothetical protein
MTRQPWASPAGPFGSEELRDVEGLDPEDVANELEIGRALERLAARDGGLPSAPFTDRVMSAVAAEPQPAPMVAATAAVRDGRGRAFLASLVDAWRVSFGGGRRPVLMRVQALALVGLLVVALAGATVGAGAILGLLGGPDPSPSVVPSPSPSKTATPSPSPSPSTSPEPSPSPSPSPEPTDGPTAGPTDEPTAEPTDEETPEPTETDDDGDSGPGGGGSGSGSGSGSDDSRESDDSSDSGSSGSGSEDSGGD